MAKDPVHTTAESSTDHRPTAPTLRQLVVAVSVVMGTVVGAFVGYIACWVVALCDIVPIGDPKDGPARVPVGEPVYIGIMVGGVILGLSACCSLLTRPQPGDRR